MLAQITDGAARAIVRNEDTENGFEIWRRLFNQLSLPTRARATNLLNEIIAFRLRQDHLESDLSDFIMLKNRHEKTTGVPLDNDLLITLIMQKTTGPFAAAPEEEGQQEGNQEEWSQDAEWYGDEWDEYDWSQDWIGSLNDWSGDWSWSEDAWSYWSDDWSWGSQDWWSAELPSASASSGSQSTANVPQDPTKSEPSQNVAAVTVETQDQNAARPSRTVRVLECLRYPAGMPEKDQLSCDDRLVEFHLQAGLVDKSWILFDSGACANCCPEWFAPDYPVLPLNESAPSLRSLSGKTLDVQGRKIVQLDCGNGHSAVTAVLRVHWDTVPTGERTLIYRCPTIIPYAVADAARMAASCLPEVMDGIENELGSVELRGVTDMNDASIDHLFQIGALIAAAQEMKAKEGYRWDMIKLANKSPVPITGTWSRLTGERVTFKQYKDGSTVERPSKEWRGRVEFGLTHKPQLTHVQKTAPRPYDPMIGRDKSKVVNDEIVEFRKADDPMEVAERANEEPEVLDRQTRVSRNVEEHELENALRSLPQHGSRMKELLLQVFNLEDPETAAPRTADRWILLPRYWIRMHHEWRDCYFHPDDAPSPVDGLLSDYLWGDRYTMFFDSSDPSQIDTGHQNEWADIKMPDGTVKTCEDPRDWCEHCVKLKGRQSHAVKKNDRQPVIQIDFSFLSTENDFPKRTILNATDAQTGYAMAIVLPAKGSIEKYAVAELRRFVFEIGRTFGIVQYDKENSLKVIAKDLCKTIGGLSMRAAPTGHSQSQGSVGNVQRTLYGKLRTLFSQLQESTGLKLTSESPMFTWCVKHAQWLINRYLIGSDGKTAYSRRWSREYNGSLCMFGEWIDAKLPIGPISNKVKIPKGGSQWFSGVYLGKDTEADEVILGNANGVFKDCHASKKKENEQFEDLAPGPSESLSVQDLLQNDGSDRAPAETVHEPPDVGENASKKARVDPDAPATEPVSKRMRISAVHHVIAGVIQSCRWLASIVGVEEVVGKDGTKIDVEVNAEEGEIDQELRLAEPLLWESEFPPEAEMKGTMKEMNSMKDFDVYDEVLVKDCTDEQVNEALDCRWVKVWKNETDLRCRVVVRGCFQNVEKNEEDNLFASAPSLVTMRLLLCMAMSRNWGITLGDVSTAFLHAAMSGEVCVWPPKEFNPNGD
eukprot:s317_g10.t1